MGLESPSPGRGRTTRSVSSLSRSLGCFLGSPLELSRYIFLKNQIDRIQRCLQGRSARGQASALALSGSVPETFCGIGCRPAPPGTSRTAKPSTAPRRFRRTSPDVLRVRFNRLSGCWTPPTPRGAMPVSGSGVIPHPSDCRRRRAGAMPAWPNAADGPQAMAREEHGQTAGGHRRGLPPCAYRSATPRRNQRVAASATARPLTGSGVWTARGRGRKGGTWEPAPVGVAPGGGPDFGERLARLTSSVKATIRARKTRALLNMRCIRLSLRPQPDSALASGRPYCAANVEKFWRLPAAPCRRAGGAALMKASRRPVLP
ncbi:hypothetical protein SAMN04244572_02466 [Azotobacter beijerinckii]|uniref:Uncharacterized protein n=1 Tax=Azotobacter beijerinckii TaxID=170623 RepID=A0A1H6VBX4_9GAMM|nr:hypothetical protein SAMN04244572_02466 [Azotobacter beijerinckii]